MDAHKLDVWIKSKCNKTNKCPPIHTFVYNIPMLLSFHFSFFCFIFILYFHLNRHIINIFSLTQLWLKKKTTTLPIQNSMWIHVLHLSLNSKWSSKWDRDCSHFMHVVSLVLKSYCCIFIFLSLSLLHQIAFQNL